MSQFADGGKTGHQTLCFQRGHIDRMSDFARAAITTKARLGDKACPFNALYWDFFSRNAERLSGNHRLAIVYRQLGKMVPDALSATGQGG